MYKADAFDKMEMMNWENQPMATKTNFTLAQAFFEKLIKSYDTYKQNAGAVSKNAYDSASRLADVGNELHKYINQIAAANAQQEEENITLPGPQRVTTATPLPTKEFEEVPNHQTNLRTNTPMITQDNGINSTPAYNARQQRITCTLTQNIACQIGKVKLDMTQVAGRQYPLQFLCNWASAVLNDETGNLLEYQHLLKHPKYKEVWSKSFGTKMQRLIMTSQTIFSI
jgi:hypothetical protein